MMKRRLYGLVALMSGLAASSDMLDLSGEDPSPREKTPEEVERERRLGEEKMAAAQAKRDRRAAKRRIDKGD